MERYSTHDRPDLACGVLCVKGEAGLVEAVRSLCAQRPAPEIVVVNSGGADPAERLRVAGLGGVRVVSSERLLLPGAARNVAVAETSAPYVAFLAADCVAEPGWVEGRLRRHRAGAAAVASVMTVAASATPSECAAHLLLHHRRHVETPEHERLLYGLSYARSVLARVGPFREDLRQGEDSELNSRLDATDRVVWAADVRTRHRHPATPGSLLRDQYGRGRRRAASLLELEPVRPRRRFLIYASANSRRALRQARRTTDPAERALLLRARPLLVPATLAYVAGGATVLAGGRPS